jgi:hypothetical protein
MQAQMLDSSHQILCFRNCLILRCSLDKLVSVLTLALSYYRARALCLWSICRSSSIALLATCIIAWCLDNFSLLCRSIQEMAICCITASSLPRGPDQVAQDCLFHERDGEWLRPLCTFSAASCPVSSIAGLQLRSRVCDVSRTCFQPAILPHTHEIFHTSN